MKSKAAVLVSLRAPLELIDVQIPPLKLGQVLVRVLTSGICGSQLGEIDGVKGPDAYLPHLLGHEGCGEVLEVGDGVKTVKPGDRVVLHWRKGAGLESVPAVYEGEHGPINAGWVTTFQEYAVVSENRVTAIPNDFDPSAAALLGCAVTTAAGALANDARLAVGESVVVLGSGGVGLAAVRLAALGGAFPIVAVDLHTNRLDLARALGATHTISGQTSDLFAAIRQIFGPHSPDILLENTGQPGMIEAALAMAGRAGRVVLVGVPPRDSRAAIDTLPLHFDQRLYGSHGGGSRPAADIPRLVRLIEAGRLDLTLLVASTYPLESVNDAIADMRSGVLAARPIIQCGACALA